jgi:cobalt-zinc-cadmium efflux system membrane fusion protein
MTRELWRTRTAVTGLLIAVLLSGCGDGGEPAEDMPSPPGTVRLTGEQIHAAEVRTDTVWTEPVALSIRVPGTVITPDTSTASVGSIVEGRVESVEVLPGDRVEAGAALAHIQSRELQEALRDVAAAKSAHDFAELAWNRAERLYAAEAISKEEVERREMIHDQAVAEQERSDVVLQHLNPSPDGRVVIQAPRAGTVFRVHIRPGEAVTLGTPLVDLGDDRLLWVTGFVPENTAIRYEEGSHVEVSFDAIPDSSVSGRVVRIGAMIDARHRAAEVRVELSRVPTGVRPGMFATLMLPDAEIADRLVLPADAVQRTADGEIVFIEEEPGLFRARSVTGTPLLDGRVVVDGIAPGLPVVTHGAYFLRAELERNALGGEGGEG